MTSTITWIILIAATLLTYWLGESGGDGGWRITQIIFTLAFVKGVLVVFDFMELRHAPRRWQLAMTGWLVFVIGVILLSYRLSMN